MANLLKWALYLFFAGLAVRFLIRHGARLGAVLREVLAGWFGLLGRFFAWGVGTSRKDSARGQPASTLPKSRPFAAYKNPFRTGAVRRLPPSELVCYSFEALLAWAREHRLERRPEQTPLEFARSLQSGIPHLSDEAGELALLFSRVAYAKATPPLECMPVLEILWEKMTAHPGLKEGQI